MLIEPHRVVTDKDDAELAQKVLSVDTFQTLQQELDQFIELTSQRLKSLSESLTENTLPSRESLDSATLRSPPVTSTKTDRLPGDAVIQSHAAGDKSANAVSEASCAHDPHRSEPVVRESALVEPVSTEDAPIEPVPVQLVPVEKPARPRGQVETTSEETKAADPISRLNAIKQRLAAQMENAS